MKVEVYDNEKPVGPQLLRLRLVQDGDNVEINIVDEHGSHLLYLAAITGKGELLLHSDIDAEETGLQVTKSGYIKTVKL